MSFTSDLEQHRTLCDEIHACALEENRFLRQHARVPDTGLLAKKRELLDRLDSSLARLRSIPAGAARDSGSRQLLEKTRSRILQILQLDRENEQLLLNCSLANPRATGSPPSAPAGMLQKIYARKS